MTPDPVPARVIALLDRLHLQIGPYRLTAEIGEQPNQLTMRRCDQTGVIAYLSVNPKHPSDGVQVHIYDVAELSVPYFCRFLRVATELVNHTLNTFSEVDYDSSEDQR